MDEERKYGVKRENEGSQPDSLVEIVSESTKTPDRREREDWLARAINYCVGLLSDQLFEIGYGTMKTICQTVLAQQPYIENPFAITTFDLDDPLLSVVLMTFHKEEHSVNIGPEIRILYEPNEKSWYYSGSTDEDSPHWDCGELTDDEIEKAFGNLMAALLVLDQVFPNTAPLISQESKSLREFLRTSAATRYFVQQDVSADG
jgi:hypothetical protein